VSELTLGVVAFVRNTFDVTKAEEIYKTQISELLKFKGIKWIFSRRTIEYVTTLDTLISKFRKEKVEGIIIISATFHLGQLIMKIVRDFQVPMLIWAIPEPPYNGGRIRLNSLVGAQLDCSNLYKSGYKNFDFVYGKLPKIRKELEKWIGALRILKSWKDARIGLLGGHAQGFFNVDVYELEILREFGVEIEYVPLYEVFKMNDIAEIENEINKIKSIYSYGKDLDEERLKKVVNLYLTFKELHKTRNYSAMAIRCWPEFAINYGISPCASMSYFMPENIPIACEGDIEGALTMMAFKAIGCNEMFLGDISQIFEEEDSLLIWHCGVAPYNVWDGESEKTLDTYFADGRGVTAGFVLKPGDVTIVRIDYAGEWRILIAEGTVLKMKKILKGTFAKVRIREAKDFVKKIFKNGFAHHIVLGYGKYGEVFEQLASMKGWKIFRW